MHTRQKAYTLSLHAYEQCLQKFYTVNRLIYLGRFYRKFHMVLMSEIDFIQVI